MPAIIPAVIAAAGSIGGALISKKKDSGLGASTPLLPAGLDQNALLADINQQKGLADLFQKQGLDMLGKGSGVLDQPLKYLQNILGGDRTAITEAMAPGIAAINAQFKAPLANAQLTGRGTALAPDLEASRQSAISGEIFKAQPAEADKLTGIAQGLMGLGASQEQAGASVLGQATAETLDYNSIVRNLQAQAAQQANQSAGGLGSAIGPILATILGGIKGGGGTTPVVPDMPTLGPGGGYWPTGDVTGSTSSINPALTSSLINLGSGGAPSFDASWLNTGKGANEGGFHF